MTDISIETINSAMSLAGSLIALLAAVITAFFTIVPKEKATAAILNLSARTMGFVIASLNIAIPIALFIFESWSTALFLVCFSAILTSIRFLRADGPATRTEIFMLLVQIAFLLFVAFMSLASRIMSLIERLA